MAESRFRCDSESPSSASVIQRRDLPTPLQCEHEQTRNGCYCRCVCGRELILHARNRSSSAPHSRGASLRLHQPLCRERCRSEDGPALVGRGRRGLRRGTTVIYPDRGAPRRTARSRYGRHRARRRPLHHLSAGARPCPHPHRFEPPSPRCTPGSLRRTRWQPHLPRLPLCPHPGGGISGTAGVHRHPHRQPPPTATGRALRGRDLRGHRRLECGAGKSPAAALPLTRPRRPRPGLRSRRFALRTGWPLDPRRARNPPRPALSADRRRHR